MNDVVVHTAFKLDRVITPEQFLAAFSERSDACFVLDGQKAPPGSNLDGAAYMGAEPCATFRARRRDERDELGRRLADVTITGSKRATRASEENFTHALCNPFQALREFLKTKTHTPKHFDARFPLPFRGGLVGYVGYECGQTLERLDARSRPSLGLPDMAFSLHRWVLGTRRGDDTSWLSVFGCGASAEEAQGDAEAIIRRVLRKLEDVRSRTRAPLPSIEARVTDDLDESAYISRIAVAKEHIAAGDAFEICLTRALRTNVPRRYARALFRQLRDNNPAPFGALLDWPECAVVSSSPERFLSLDAHGVAESRPIKGTRPRGNTPNDDDALARDLASSEKDRAENAMIVDLVRNDLGRVCAFGTVHVPHLYEVERYATVHQLVSTIRGTLAPDADAVDLLSACFPPGSMTGAPKIEAMKLIEALEPVERGIYSGALGWLDVGGAMDLSVVIRTVVMTDEGASVSVGGAIVADSNPASEYEETQLKARALERALRRVAESAE